MRGRSEVVLCRGRAPSRLRLSLQSRRRLRPHAHRLNRFACIGCTRNATQRRASSGAYNSEWTRTLRGGRGAAVCNVARIDPQTITRRLVRAPFLGRTNGPVARPPAHPSQRGMRAASAREEREGLAEHYRAARSLHGTIEKGTPCRRTRASVCRHPAGGNSSTCAWQQQPMMRWDGAVEVPPVL